MASPRPTDTRPTDTQGPESGAQDKERMAQQGEIPLPIPVAPGLGARLKGLLRRWFGR
ncbi:hypothetical protein [Oceanibaculum pacificum]|uniref:hypothetical protein n=1 Tax=Oceanibaculum pacificum TaxID=580166 RepID=UPI0012EEAD80|nr:hypothetical protein [Oceanibaculum pacificum]